MLPPLEICFHLPCPSKAPLQTALSRTAQCPALLAGSGHFLTSPLLLCHHPIKFGSFWPEITVQIWGLGALLGYINSRSSVKDLC